MRSVSSPSVINPPWAVQGKDVRASGREHLWVFNKNSNSYNFLNITTCHTQCKCSASIISLKRHRNPVIGINTVLTLQMRLWLREVKSPAQSRRQWAGQLDVLPELWLYEACTPNHYARRHCIIGYCIPGPFLSYNAPPPVGPANSYFSFKNPDQAFAPLQIFHNKCPRLGKCIIFSCEKSSMPYSPRLQHLSLVV